MVINGLINGLIHGYPLVINLMVNNTMAGRKIHENNHE